MVLAPDLSYRGLPNDKLRDDEVEQAMAMTYRLELGEPMEDLQLPSRQRRLARELTRFFRERLPRAA